MFQHYHTFKTLLWDIATPGKQIGVALCLLALVACSGDRLGSGTTQESLPAQCQDDPNLPECQVPAAGIYLTLSSQEIQSDGSDSTTVTATVLDENNAVIEGVQVDFSANAGKLSKRFIFTDEFGESAVDFSASRADPTNQVVTVTATVAGVGTASIPVRIVGTTLEIVVDNSTLLIEAGSTQVQEVITVVAKDAGGQLVYDVPIDFSISGLAGASLSDAQVRTDTFGEAVVTLTASASGTVSFVAIGLGTQATQTFTVSNVVTDNPFRITSPTTDPYPLTSDGSTVAIQVAAAGVTTVRFTTTIGVWTDGSAPNTSVTDVAVAGGVATATLQARAGVSDQGFATIVASDAAAPTTFDTITVAMSPPFCDAAQLYLQTDVKTLPLSSDTTTYSANITAVVKTDNASGNYPIYNVPVSFTLSSTTGGGELLSQSYGSTDLNGKVNTKLTSGKTSTGQKGVTITATIVGGAACAPPLPVISDNIAIGIGGTAGSVTIGTPRVIIQDDNNKSINIWNMSVQVADGTGAGVAGAVVTLEVWPESYLVGTWYDANPDVDVVEMAQFFPYSPHTNEDLDENLILDNPSVISGLSEDVNSDGELTPKNSDAGTVPVSLVTREDGTAAFDYTYLKDYALWVRVRIRATTKVLGTEVTSTRYFIPDMLKSEYDAGYLYDSPYVFYLHGQPGGVAYTVDVPVANFGTAAAWQVRFAGVQDLGYPTSSPGTINGLNEFVLDPAWAAGEVHEVTFTGLSTNFGILAVQYTAFVIVR